MILDSGYWPDAHADILSSIPEDINLEIDDFTVPGIQEWVDRIIDEWILAKKARKMTGLR